MWTPVIWESMWKPDEAQLMKTCSSWSLWCSAPLILCVLIWYCMYTLPHMLNSANILSAVQQHPTFYLFFIFLYDPWLSLKVHQGRDPSLASHKGNSQKKTCSKTCWLVWLFETKQWLFFTLWHWYMLQAVQPNNSNCSSEARRGNTNSFFFYHKQYA